VDRFLSQQIPQRGVEARLRRTATVDATFKAGLKWVHRKRFPVDRWKLSLSRWQNIFFCEFDGQPRSRAASVVTVLADRYFCLRPLPGGSEHEAQGGPIRDGRSGNRDDSPVGSRQKKKIHSGRLESGVDRRAVWGASIVRSRL